MRKFGYRIPAEFVASSVLLFLTVQSLPKGVSFLHLLARDQVYVVSVPSIPVISQHNLNPGLQPSTLGKICRECAISLISRLTPIYTIYGLLSTTSGLGVRHRGPACQTAGLLGYCSMSLLVLLTAWWETR
jgi:hypothetical protein